MNVNVYRELTFDCTRVSREQLLNAVTGTNEYIVALDGLFNEVGFDLFEVLGQRNLSGVIGGIFSRFLVNGHESLVDNPHPDGRPDILSLETEEARTYFKSCFTLTNQRRIPNKSMLAPFKYGGVEVKCTLGDPMRNYQTQLAQQFGKTEFELGIPRITFLRDLNWWAHHPKSTNLLGLYYDYLPEHSGLPQILAGFFGQLLESDWTKVSIGDSEHKKTSNTSLNACGKSKMKNGCLFCVDDPAYLDKLRSIGVGI